VRVGGSDCFVGRGLQAALAERGIVVSLRRSLNQAPFYVSRLLAFERA